MSDSTAKTQQPERRFDMRVAAKMLQSISTGIYRTPANAIKELVSNAFDADATRVDINIEADSDYSISSISIKDNGVGIAPNDFEFSMTHIGSSLKRVHGNFTPTGRPIIGRIGIGLLSVGQASHKFTFMSTIKGLDYVMRAEIDLTPYYNAITLTKSLDELKIGNVEIYKESGKSSEHFTQILLRNIREPFAKDLTHHAVSESIAFDFSSKLSYEQFVKWIDESEIKRDEAMSGFNRFMFELGLLTPVRYLAAGPIKNYTNVDAIKEIKKTLENYNFSVFVNNIEIFKPILYPHVSDEDLTKKEIDYRVYALNINEHLGDNKRLVAKGYFYHQARRLLPWTLRGVLLRVNNVGIGTYENRFSKISIETPIILQQFTGEIYVEEGLDDALNIDRNSFFESDEAYQTLYRFYQEFIDKISRDIGKRMETRQTSMQRQRTHTSESVLELKIKEMFNQLGYSEYEKINLYVKMHPFKPPNVVINRARNSVSVRVQLSKSYRKSVRQAIIPVLVAVQLSLEESRDSRKSFNEIFSRLINNLEI